MQKGCVAIVIINMEEPKNPGIVLMKSCMPTECVIIAISIPIIEKGENREMKKHKTVRYRVN